MLTVGLTGGIGSGKTAASDHFRRLGVPLVDADVVAREVVEPGEPALDAIAHHFGAGILQQDGTLDRRALREIIFRDTDAKDWLEELLHPRIRQRIARQLQDLSGPYALLVSPLLLETQQAELVDRILLIECDAEIQVARVSARDNTDARQTRTIIEQQMHREERKRWADDVIENNGSLAQLHGAVEKLHDRYLAMAGNY